jgi:hypothetical protein
LNNDFDKPADVFDDLNAEAVAVGSLAYADCAGVACPEAMVGLLIATLIIDANYQYDIYNGIAGYEDCIRRNCSRLKKPIEY